MNAPRWRSWLRRQAEHRMTAKGRCWTDKYIRQATAASYASVQRRRLKSQCQRYALVGAKQCWSQQTIWTAALTVLTLRLAKHLGASLPRPG